MLSKSVYSKKDAYYKKMEKIGTMPSQRDQTDIIRIGVLPIDGFALMSYASTVEPFRAAKFRDLHTDVGGDHSWGAVVEVRSGDPDDDDTPRRH